MSGRSFTRSLVVALLVTTASVRVAGADKKITVSVAASLRDIVTALADDFHKTHAKVEITINAGPSGLLAQQIEQGAPVDVFVSAGRLEIDRLVEKKLVAGKPVTIARNRLVLVVPRGSAWEGKPPREVLTSPDVKKVATGDPETVPFGRYAKQALTSAQLWDTVQPKMIFAMDVRQALTYAQRKEVDAAVVYATDATGNDGVVALGEVPGGQTVQVEAVAARLARAEAGAAERFLEYLASPPAAAEFVRRGFLPPGP